MRIQWTYNLERSLLEIGEMARKAGKEGGFIQALEQLWRSLHPTLPSKGTALVQKLRKVKAARKLDVE